MQDLKTETLKLAGFVAANAVWLIRDGETLIPNGCSLDADGSRSLHTFFDEELAVAASISKKWLDENPGKARSAATAIDGYVTFAERMDAIVIEARSYEDPLFSLNIYVPYRPAKAAKLLGLLGRKQALVIHRPKFANLAGLDKDDFELLGEAFFSGSDEHEKLRPFWEAHYDPSK